MNTFPELVASRQDWIDRVLRPWCRAAPLAELRKAAHEWHDIAGRVDADHTLWLWAWSRFPVLYVEGLNGLEETYEVQVTLRDGATHVGYPDSTPSLHGRLVLSAAAADGRRVDHDPVPIDQIAAVERV